MGVVREQPEQEDAPDRQLVLVADSWEFFGHQLFEPVILLANSIEAQDVLAKIIMNMPECLRYVSCDMEGARFTPKQQSKIKESRAKDKTLMSCNLVPARVRQNIPHEVIIGNCASALVNVGVVLSIGLPTGLTCLIELLDTSMKISKNLKQALDEVLTLWFAEKADRAMWKAGLGRTGILFPARSLDLQVILPQMVPNMAEVPNLMMTLRYR
jgi:hypothetical protein